MATNSKHNPLFDTQAGVRLAFGGASVNESPETARVADVASHPLNAEHRRPVWLTAREAAQYLSVEPRTVLLWARQGKLRGFKLSGTKRHVWRFRHCDLDAMLTGPSVALRTKGAQ
jgi:excisionase family DNA binding protein